MEKNKRYDIVLNYIKDNKLENGTLFVDLDKNNIFKIGKVEFNLEERNYNNAYIVAITPSILSTFNIKNYSGIAKILEHNKDHRNLKTSGKYKHNFFYLGFWKNDKNIIELDISIMTFNLGYTTKIALENKQNSVYHIGLQKCLEV